MRVVLDRSTTYGLGGLTIDVAADGTVSFVKSPFFEHETELRHEAKIDPKPIFDAFAAEFRSIEIPEHTGFPDELYVSLAIEDAGGRAQRGKFVGTPHPVFDRLVELVREHAARAVDRKTRERLTL